MILIFIGGVPNYIFIRSTSAVALYNSSHTSRTLKNIFGYRLIMITILILMAPKNIFIRTTSTHALYTITCYYYPFKKYFWVPPDNDNHSHYHFQVYKDSHLILTLCIQKNPLYKRVHYKLNFVYKVGGGVYGGDKTPSLCRKWRQYVSKCINDPYRIARTYILNPVLTEEVSYIKKVPYSFIFAV